MSQGGSANVAGMVGGGLAGAMNEAGAGGTTGSAGAAPVGGMDGSAGNAGAGAGAPGDAGTGGMGTAGTGTAGMAGSGGADASRHPTYDGFELWLAEDFDQALDLQNHPVWTYSDGGFQTHRFTEDSVTFEDGKMVLTLSDEVQPTSCTYSGMGDIPEQPRTSGELRTKHNWFRYGRYETRLKVPMVQPNDPAINGNYIASLFIYRTPACQGWREIDIEITGDSASSYGSNLITGEDCNWSADKEDHERVDLPGLNFRTGFVTVGFEWLPGKITWYTLDDAGAQTNVRVLESANVPDVPGKLMMNLWVFSEPFNFGGPDGANNELPFRAEYDFVRFYKWNMDMEYPCPDFSDTCLAAEDIDLTKNNSCDGIPELGDRFTCEACGETVRTACMPACGE